jgi:predicted permease
MNRTIDALARDIGAASRRLKRSPVFTAVVVFTLALGIGANAAVLGVIDAMFYRKLPVPHPERVVAVYSGKKRDAARAVSISGFSAFSDFAKLQPRIAGVTGLAAYGMGGVNAPELFADTYTWTAFVTGTYFNVLDVRAQTGRTIVANDDDSSAVRPVAVISDYLWRTKFDADVGVLGRQVRIGKTDFTIIGVAPRGFTGVHPEGRTNLWIPYSARQLATGDTSFAARGGSAVQIIGRLETGASLQQFQTSVAHAEQGLRETYPAADSLLALRGAIRDRLTTPELSENGLIWIWVVWVLVALLHLAACSNVASLMLARADARRRELGVRLCLGASRARILGESLTEASLLAVAGGVGGIVIGRWLSGLIATMEFLSTSDPALDMRVVALIAVVTLGTLLQFGFLPAIEATRTDPLELLRASASSRRRGGLDRAGMVVVAQVTVSLLLLGNAAAFLEMFARQVYTDSGYDVEHLLTVSMTPHDGYAAHDYLSVYNETVSRLRALPGVQSIAAAEGAPLLNPSWYDDIIVPGNAASTRGRTQAALQSIGPGYFTAIGTPMVRGREFDTNDRVIPGQTRDFDVVVVNESMARQYWPGENPLGKQMGLRKATPATVVGVVRDIHDISTLHVTPRAYFPLLETRFGPFTLVVRVAGDPKAMVSTISSALAGSSFGRPSIRLSSQIRDDALSLSRVAGSSLTLSACVALVLAAIGLYGIVTMWAVRRRAEIGIRLALGSPSSAVHRLLLTEVWRLLAVGGTLGIVCAYGLVQVERGRLGPYLSLDVVAIASTLSVLGIIGGVAAFVPSWRASKQSPADVLRSA